MPWWQATPPVSSNIKLFILIKWKTIEMSVNVAQQKAIEILCSDRRFCHKKKKSPSLCQGGIFRNNSRWIEHATNLFGGKEYFKGKVFSSAPSLKLSSVAVCAYIRWISLSFYLIPDLYIKRWHRKKKLYLIWLLHVENKTELMNNIDSQFTWIMFSRYDAGAKHIGWLYFCSWVKSQQRIKFWIVQHHKYLLLIYWFGVPLSGG